MVGKKLGGRIFMTMKGAEEYAQKEEAERACLLDPLTKARLIGGLHSIQAEEPTILLDVQRQLEGQGQALQHLIKQAEQTSELTRGSHLAAVTISPGVNPPPLSGKHPRDGGDGDMSGAEKRLLEEQKDLKRRKLEFELQIKQKEEEDKEKEKKRVKFEEETKEKERRRIAQKKEEVKLEKERKRAEREEEFEEQRDHMLENLRHSEITMLERKSKTNMAVLSPDLAEVKTIIEAGPLPACNICGGRHDGECQLLAWATARAQGEGKTIGESLREMWSAGGGGGRGGRGRGGGEWRGGDGRGRGRGRGRGGGVCYTCGSPDHYSTTCPQKLGSTKCYVCGELGHVSFGCPYRYTNANQYYQQPQYQQQELTHQTVRQVVPLMPQQLAILPPTPPTHHPTLPPPLLPPLPPPPPPQSVAPVLGQQGQRVVGTQVQVPVYPNIQPLLTAISTSIENFQGGGGVDPQASPMYPK